MNAADRRLGHDEEGTIHVYIREQGEPLTFVWPHGETAGEALAVARLRAGDLGTPERAEAIVTPNLPARVVLTWDAYERGNDAPEAT